jgi:hypothetical protein
VTVRTASISLPIGTVNQTVAHCNAGERAVGGGGAIDTSATGSGILTSFPTVGSAAATAGQTPDGWEAAARNASGVDTNPLTVYVVCAAP